MVPLSMWKELQLSQQRTKFHLSCSSSHPIHAKVIHVNKEEIKEYVCLCALVELASLVINVFLCDLRDVSFDASL